jgi:hypothetical protein
MTALWPPRQVTRSVPEQVTVYVVPVTVLCARTLRLPPSVAPPAPTKASRTVMANAQLVRGVPAYALRSPPGSQTRAPLGAVTVEVGVAEEGLGSEADADGEAALDGGEVALDVEVANEPAVPGDCDHWPFTQPTPQIAAPRKTTSTTPTTARTRHGGGVSAIVRPPQESHRRASGRTGEPHFGQVG